jgi:hypothetical protein
MPRNGDSVEPILRRMPYRWLWWGLWAVGILATLVLGYIGFLLHPETGAGGTGAPDFTDVAYLVLQLFTLESGSVLEPHLTLEIARFLAPAVVGYTLVLAAVSLGFQQFRLWRNRIGSGHVVICGLGHTGYTLAVRYRALGKRVVAIELDEENDLVRPCVEKGIAVLYGSAADADVLRRAGVGKAETLVATCGDESLNAAIALRARELPRHRTHDPLCCHVHVTDPELLTFLREDAWRPEHPDASTLEFFNLFDLGAEIMLNQPGAPAGNVDSPPGGILLAGFGYMGRSLLVRLVRRWWSLGGPERHGRLPVVVVDTDAARLIRQLQHHYPAMEKTCDLIPIDDDIRTLDFQEAGFRERLPSGMNLSASLFISLGDDTLSLSTALRMHRSLGAAGSLGIPPVSTTVMLTRLGGLSSLLTGTVASAGVRLFGLLDQACTPEALCDAGLVERLARALHESYLRGQYGDGKEPGSKPALFPWKELKRHYQDSNRDQARWVPLRLHQTGFGIRPRNDWSAPLHAFTEAELGVLGALEHQRWVDFNASRKVRYGSERDEKRRLHHCMVEWEKLTAEEQEWDRRFFRDLPEILSHLGYDIYRKSPIPA